jgi:hypothetical protein
MEYKLRPLFKKFQRELVAFANTSYGRDFISCFGGKAEYPIVKITPDSFHEQLDKKTFRATFFPRSPFVGKFAEVLTMMDIASDNYKFDRERSHLVIPHFMGETRLLAGKLPLIFLDSGTFYPDAHPESTSVDGYAGRVGSAESWATIIAGAGTVAVTSASTLDYFFLSDNTSDTWARVHRLIVLFDTSSLGDSAIVSSATCSFYQTTTFINTFGGAFCLVQSTPASNTDIANADYAQVGTTQQASDINMSSVSQSAYNDFTLNATGIASISLTSVTKFGSRFSFDRTGTPPTWQGNLRNQLDFNSGDNASNKPKLVVTYTYPSLGVIII